MPALRRVRLPLQAACLALALAALAGCASHGGYAPGYARRSYTPPGPPEDPWGPYIREAAGRFQVPEAWVRAVMRQESGGHEYLGSRPITSWAGAMGLMQVMPATYATLRDRYGLGADPYEPHDNIMAGTAYIREMYDRYGSPGFLAAYNAGPQRLDDYLAGSGALPDETISYLSNVAPRLGDSAGMTGPLAMFAQGGGSPPATGYAPATPPPSAFQMAEAPPVPVPTVAEPAPILPPIASSSGFLAPPPAPRPAGAWAVQVGAFSTADEATDAAYAARTQAQELAATNPLVGVTTRGDGLTLYRARLIGLSRLGANDACRRLSADGIACMVVPPDRAS